MLNGAGISSRDLIRMAQQGRDMTRRRELTAPFELMGATITLAASTQADLARRLTSANVTSISGHIEEFSTRLKEKSLTEEERAKVLADLKLLVENPATSQEEAMAKVLADYVVEIRQGDFVDETPQVTLGWIVKIGIILADYDSSMAGLPVAFDREMAEQLLTGSRMLNNFVVEKLSDIEAFYAARSEAELGNSGGSQPSTPTDSSRAAEDVATPSSKSSGAATGSSENSTD